MDTPKTLAEAITYFSDADNALNYFAAKRWPNGVFYGHDDCEMRVEHWTNAAEQGAAAARNLLASFRGGEQVPYESVPFFWSDQFESRIQFVGRAHGGDDLHVVAGSLDGAFAAVYGWEGRLRGALGVSMPKVVMPLRALIAQKAPLSAALELALPAAWCEAAGQRALVVSILQ